MPRIYLFVLFSALAFGQDREVNFYSEAKEAALGAQIARQIRIEKRALGSAAVEDYADRIGRTLAPQLPEYGPGYRFEVFAGAGSRLRAPDMVPGGYIFVPAELLLAVESEAEFAGMLAHSMAHSAARHGTRMAARGKITDLSSIPLIFMGGWTGLHGSEMALAVPLGFLSFLREYELEADRMAVQAMARAGYDPAALVRYIERMQTDPTTDKSRKFSPLPPREERLAGLSQAIAELPKLKYYRNTGQYEGIREEVRGLLQVQPPTVRPPTLRR